MKKSIFTALIIESIEYISNSITPEVYKRELTETEIKDKKINLAALNRAVIDLGTVQGNQIDPEFIANLLIMLSWFSANNLFARICKKEVQESIQICKEFLQLDSDRLHQYIMVEMLHFLENTSNNKTHRLLAWCVRYDRLPLIAASCLVRSLGYPIAGEIKQFIDGCVPDENPDNKNKFFRKIGIDLKSLKYDKKKSRLKRYKIQTDQLQIQEKTQAARCIDLSGQRIKKFPDFIYHCKKLKILIIEDDYFSCREMKKIESKLPNVIVEWRHNCYIDGKHGR